MFSLPPEILQRILFDVDPEHAIFVNQDFFQACVESTKRKELYLVQEFLKFIAKKLPNSDTDLKGKISTLAKDKKILESENLSAIKSSLVNIR